MRTAMRAIPEEEGPSRQPAAVWQGHLQSLWIDMTKEELEEEVQWRADDQMVLLETIENLKEALKKKEEEVLRQYKVIDRQRAYIDSLHALMQQWPCPQ